MSVFREGYISILPRELRDELAEYLFDYLNSLVTLNTHHMYMIFEEEIGSNKDVFEFNNESQLTFQISINLPPEYSTTPLNFKFVAELQQLNTFIKEYISTHAFHFVEELKLGGNLTPDSGNYNVESASHGILTNLDENSCINLYDYTSNLIGFGYETRAGNTVVIQELTQMQSEILIYKLIKFHNDLIAQRSDDKY